MKKVLTIKQHMDYRIKKQTNYPFAEAVAKTKAALSKEGFGILTEIDVRATLKSKLDTVWDDYVILGACNPPLAFEALQAEKEIGLFLPCNVLVYNDGGKIFVSAILPSMAMSMIENPTLADIAKRAEGKLIKVINNI